MGCCADREARQDGMADLKSSDQSTAIQATKSLKRDLNEPTKSLSKSQSSRISKSNKKQANSKTNANELNKWISKNDFVKTDKEYIKTKYQFIKRLSVGSFGYIMLVTDKKTNENKIIKEIQKTFLSVEMQKCVCSESEKLYFLDHPNIVKLYEIVEDNQSFYLVSEYYPGGDLFEKILENPLSEQLAKKYMQDILIAVNYCHSRGVIHRNIRPENIIFSTNQADGVLKLTDFGSIWQASANSCKVWSIHYMAPEMIKGSLNKRASDIWSIGVILYVMLTGKPPFVGKTEKELIASINKGLSLGDKELAFYSAELKDLISKMLDLNYKQRISALDALNHPWFSISNASQESKNFEESLKLLAQFNAQSKIEKSIYQYIVSQFSNQCEEKAYIELFRKLDKDHNGILSREELISGCRALGVCEESNVEEILDRIDMNRSGSIDYSEFVAAVINWNSETQIKKLEQVFQLYDADGNGTLSLHEMKKAIPGIPNAQWKKFFKEADINGDGMISTYEFKEYVLKKRNN
ncbi:unnamed protein product [Blepharisma stoltei]|uniref:Calcium-dependent protein kinase n=1 Tax=Blepharisma stoltei TaxID=1481888 RepID=A0AAU9JXH0_9CILI|nr:unnamed protein product [Blepharisma stoltei]